MVLAAFAVPYIEARCAPNLIVMFFGRGPSGAVPTSASDGGRKEAFQEASCAVSSCWRAYLGNLCRPKSLAEFEPVWNALWNPPGHAIEILRDEQSGEVTSPAPTTKCYGTPLMIAPGQNERVMLCSMERTLPDEDHEIVPSFRVRERVSLGSGRCPSAGSFGVCINSRKS
jgi:hypothetical protein